MANMRSFCFIIAFHNFATLENRLTYQCPSSWPVVITMKKKLADIWKKKIGYWPVQINGNKFATSQTPEETGRSCEGVDFSWLSSKVYRTLNPASLVITSGGHGSIQRAWHLVLIGHKYPNIWFSLLNLPERGENQAPFTKFWGTCMYFVRVL